MQRARRAKIIRRRLAGPDHAVVSMQGGGHYYRRTPCAECPWRRDVPAGRFPAEAFRISAHSAWDAAMSLFACHMSKVRIFTCAGFLLSEGAAHNILMRLAQAQGFLDMRAVSSPFPLFSTYREMAIANGVDPEDSALRHCLDDGRG
jgi:hypothetical protein